MSSLIYGRHPVLEALKGGEDIDKILVANGAILRGTLDEILQRAEEGHVPVDWVPRSVLDRAAAGAGSGNHQGVIALTADFPYGDVPTILAAAIRCGEAAFILVLDTVQDVHNLGGLIRTAVAVGVHGILIPEKNAPGITPAVRKASAGAVAHLVVARVAVPSALDGLRKRGLWVVGLDAGAEAPYTDCDLTGPIAVVVGGEAQGLRRAMIRRCDQLVRLPMVGPIDSLNANVAGSVVLYEVLRQRSAGSANP